jgi:hypothetical protein
MRLTTVRGQWQLPGARRRGLQFIETLYGYPYTIRIPFKQVQAAALCFRAQLHTPAYSALYFLQHLKS